MLRKEAVTYQFTLVDGQRLADTIVWQLSQTECIEVHQ